ncbi:unnamed protein product [Aspergillus oryzae]|nr:unnamed protein product [Aspergillus oryzae]GMF95494.1 unnamed protein product [Aspergillus oryzae]
MQKSKRNTCLPPHLWNSNSRPDVKPSGVDSLDKPSGEDANQNRHSARIHVPLHVLPTANATDSQEHYNGPVSPQQTGCKFIQDGKPSRKYLISWKIDQAGPGWIGLENSPGYPEEVLIKLKTMGKKHYGQSNLRAAAHPNIVDLLEAFYHGTGWLNKNIDTKSQEVQKHFVGFAKISLQQLSPEFDTEENVKWYSKRFTLDECSRLDPEHFVIAVITEDQLNRAILDTGIAREGLSFSQNPPHLMLEKSVVLPCLRGRDLLEAARRFLPPGEKWWTARLYLNCKELSPDEP